MQEPFRSQNPMMEKNKQNKVKKEICLKYLKTKTKKTMK